MNYKIIQGNPFAVKLTVTDSITKLPINLIGRSLLFILKHATDVANNNTSALINSSVLLNDSNATNGIALLNIDSSLTNIAIGRYKYEVATLAGTTKETHQQGVIDILDSYIKV